MDNKFTIMDNQFANMDKKFTIMDNQFTNMDNVTALHRVVARIEGPKLSDRLLTREEC